MAFVKATKKKAKARIALLGPSGAGKTFSALAIGKHLGKRVAVIDTERGSASKYAGDVADFDVCELVTFEPQKYINMLADAAREGYDVVVVDSLSHAWMGTGGIIDQKDKKGGNGFDAWRTLTPQHNALVEAILSYPGHVIATMRSKMEYVQEKDKSGKTVIRKVGMAPVQREGMEYEFDLIGELDIDHTLHVTKSRCAALADQAIRKPGADLAKQLLEWLDQGVDEQPRPTMPPTTSSKSDASSAQTSSETGTTATSSSANGSSETAPPTETGSTTSGAGQSSTPTTTKRANPDMAAVINHAIAIAAAEDGELLATLHDRVGDVVGDSEKLSFALQALVQQRAAQLADAAWDGNEKEQKAVAWIRGQMPTTTTAQAA
jgi:hypothetical protein